MKYGFKAGAERDSLKLREEIGIGANDRICCFELLRHLKIPTFSVSQFNEQFKFGQKSVKALKTGNGQKEFSAILLGKPEGNIIIYNCSHSDKRIRSTIAHEVAHVLCGHSFLESAKGNKFLLREHPKDMEDEANWLSACILIPRRGIEWAVRQGMKIPEITEHFDVSTELARWRYNTTGVAKQAMYRRRKSKSF